MLRNILTIAIIFHVGWCLAQEVVSFKQGGTQQTNYYSTIPYDDTYGLIIVKASINGKEYRFILDTGAPMIISQQLFDELNPDVLINTLMSDANAMTDSVVIVSLKEITLGDVMFADIPAVVDKRGLFLECFHADGFIGSNLLKNSIVQFSHLEKTVTITDKKKRLALHSKQSVRMYQNDQYSPYLLVILQNKETIEDYPVFDTGMTGLYDVAMSNFDIFDKYGIFDITGQSRGSNSLSFHGIGKDTVQYKLQLPILEINGAKLKNVTVNTTFDDGSRIGNKLLTYGNVTVDYRKSRFYFEPFFEEELDVYEKSFPVDFVPRDNHLYVGFVWDESLEGQIKVGDQVMTINGMDYENISICDIIMRQAEYKDQQKLTLTTKNERGEIIETIIVKL